MNAQAFTLTKALDEADHTSPAPFRWHLHGADSLTRTQWVKWEKKKNGGILQAVKYSSHD